MPRTMTDSENLYKVARKFFDYLVGTTAIVEISDLPMESWKVLQIYSDDELNRESIRLSKSKIAHVTFCIAEDDGENLFHYTDENIMKCEKCRMGEIEYFYDQQADELMLDQARQEMKELVKHLIESKS